MVEIVSSDTDIERELRELCDLVRDNGGLVDDGLTIRALDGNVRIEASPDITKGKRILHLPSELLLPLDEFDVAVEGNDFVLNGVNREVSKVRRALMERQLAIYNLTGKIADHQKCATANLYFHDADLLQRIFGKEVLERLKVEFDENHDANMFLRTRRIGAKVVAGGTAQSALMPVIDFLNHHILADDFKMGEAGLFVQRYSPEGGATECFVRYGVYDALDMLNNYNYVESNPCFVYVRPMEIEVPGLGTIDIKLRNRKFISKKELPESLRGLRGFFPPIQCDEGSDRVSVGFLRIPMPNSPRALRRMAAALISILASGEKPNNTIELIDFVEREVIERTRTFYEDLKRDMEVYEDNAEIATVIQNIRDVAQVQLGHLAAYDYEKARASQPVPRPGR